MAFFSCTPLADVLFIPPDDEFSILSVGEEQQWVLSEMIGEGQSLSFTDVKFSKDLAEFLEYDSETQSFSYDGKPEIDSIRQKNNSVEITYVD